jgi:hypothetical protein
MSMFKAHKSNKDFVIIMTLFELRKFYIIYYQALSIVEHAALPTAFVWYIFIYSDLLVFRNKMID